MTALEDRLTTALADTANTVREDGLRPLTAPARHRRRWSWAIAPAAAAVTVAVILGIEVGVVRMNGPRQPPQGPVPANLTVGVGGSPVSMAFDPATSTLYTVTAPSLVGRPPQDTAGAHSPSLALVNAATCNATTTHGCDSVAHVPTGGRGVDEHGIALNPRTRTVYVLNAGSRTLAMINAATCNAVTTRDCANRPQAAALPGSPSRLAVNPRTDTIYLLDGRTGALSVMSGETCNAADARGCQEVTTVHVGAIGRIPILTVDPVTDTVYLAGNGELAVIDGRTCNGTDVSGCGSVLATRKVGQYPADMVVDDSTGTLYLSEPGTGLTAIDRNTCSAIDTAGCARRATVARAGVNPQLAAADQQAHTLYVAGTGNTVTMVSTTGCNARTDRGCRLFPPSFPVGWAPGEIAVAPALHTVYVANRNSQRLSVINAAACNAATTRGCPRTSAGGAPTARQTAYTCDSALAQYQSGAPAGPMLRGHTRVVTGTVGGQHWSVWAKTGEFDPNGIEQGGLVINGRWYSVCQSDLSAGANGDFALIDAGAHGVVYGYVQHPYRVRIRLKAPGVPAWSPSSVLLPGTTFFISQLPRSACSYREISVRVGATQGPAWSGSQRRTFSTCQPNLLVPTVRGTGDWGPGIAN